MPRSFPDYDSLKRIAACHEFRQPYIDEPEAEYRSLLADHVAARDVVESQEIRTGKGWDKWNDDEQLDLLRAQFQKHRRQQP